MIETKTAGPAAPTLAEATDRAVRLVGEYQAALETALTKAKAAGDALIVVRDHPDMKHGMWKRWVEEHFPQSYEKAIECITVAENWHQIAPHQEANPGLSKRAALEIVRGERRPAEEEGAGVMPDPGRGGDDFDAAPEEAGPTRTKPGDLWLIRGGGLEHRLLVGDCTDPGNVARLLAGEVPFQTVADPPWGVGYDPGWRQKAFPGGERRLGRVVNDDRVDWTEAYRLSGADVAYVWHAGRRAGEVQASLEAAGYEIRAPIVWAKPGPVISRGHYHSQHESCFYAVRKGKSARWSGGRSQVTVWQIPNRVDREDRNGHGTQKPLECMARPISNHGKPGDLVYDPFLGTGTTLIAAHRWHRRCYGCEIDPRWADVILKRAEAEGLVVEMAEASLVLPGPDDDGEEYRRRSDEIDLEFKTGLLRGLVYSRPLTDDQKDDLLSLLLGRGRPADRVLSHQHVCELGAGIPPEKCRTLVHHFCHLIEEPEEPKPGSPDWCN